MNIVFTHRNCSIFTTKYDHSTHDIKSNNSLNMKWSKQLMKIDGRKREKRQIKRNQSSSKSSWNVSY